MLDQSKLDINASLIGSSDVIGRSNISPTQQWVWPSALCWPLAIPVVVVFSSAECLQ